MSKKCLYFIAFGFPPIGRGNALTNACIAKHLSNRFNVEVITAGSGCETTFVATQKDQSFVDELSACLQVRHVKAPVWGPLGEFLYMAGIIPCYHANCAWSVRQRMSELFAQPGVMLAIYPLFSDLMVAAAVKKKFNWPLVIDLRDDYYGVMAHGKNALFRKRFKSWERYYLNLADEITVATPMIKSSLIERYGLSEDKIHVVYNVVPPSKDTLSDEDWQLGQANFSAQNNSRKFRIVYAGTISKSQKPEILIQAYQYLKETQPEVAAEIDIQFYGPENHYFHRVFKQHLSEDIRFNGFIPYHEMIQELSKVDLGFFSLSDGPAYAYATPTKLFEFIDLEKPILAVLPQGPARAIIEENGLGQVITPGDVKGLAEAILSLYKDEQQRERYRAAVRAIKPRFSVASQVEKYVEIVDRLGQERL